MRPADLDLGAAESGGLCSVGLVDQLRHVQMQPSAFSRVDRDALLCATDELPQR
jgi:hypothetical protein